MTGLEYREIKPAQAPLPYIECYWTLRANRDYPGYPVLPDGCADLLFSSAPELQLVGNMTAARSFSLSKGTDLLGVRFHPAMAVLFVQAPWQELANQSIPAAGTRQLAEQIGATNQLVQRVAAIENWLRPVRDPGPVQRIVSAGATNPPMDELSRQAGLSSRHLRRLFLAEIGLAPKHLFRILRFRRAIQRMACRQSFASLASEVGYYDQAHFIHEFREFSGGYTPAAWQIRMADFSNPVSNNRSTLAV